ncbi:hypothetical protein NMG60_11006196 [Bertholletia excelsa]
MEGNKRGFFKKHSNPQFKKKGGSKKGKLHNSNREQSSENSNVSDTVYRILCHSRKIGSVIGKGGSIVKSLREETQAKITVADSVPGSDERVIIIYSPSAKIHRKGNSTEDQDLSVGKENDLEPYCAAQDALLKVHDRIVEEDLVGGLEDEDDNEIVVTARLLVPNNMVGCLLGRKGDVIQRLRSDTGASIRVLPADHLPACAMRTDELVQISGKAAVAKRALYEVSTLLHQNPRKEKPPLNFPLPHGGPGFQPPGPPMANLPPPGNPMWSQRQISSGDVPPAPWMGGYGNHPTDFGPGGFSDAPPMHDGEAPNEFSMKILCLAGKIGGVIGKAGANVKQLQQETGASIHVEDASGEVEERVIRVSSLEALWNPRSQTIEAILQLQNKTSEFSEKGIITTRLLVPSSKVGCILGQGGHIINEMRRRTQADIRVYSKEDKPKCAADDEELVQVSGSFGVARDALGEIASRLRVRCLRDASGGAEPPPVGPVKKFGPAGGIPVGSQHPSGPFRVGSSSGYEFIKGGGREYEARGYDRREYESMNYPIPPSATGYTNINSGVNVKMPKNAIGTGVGTGLSNMSEIPGTRLKLQDHRSGGSECVVEIHGSSEHLNAAQNILQAFRQNVTPPQGSYQNYNSPRSTYQNYNPQQSSYTNISTPQNPYHSINPPQNPYQNMNAQRDPYQSMSAQQAPYKNVSTQGSYHY